MNVNRNKQASLGSLRRRCAQSYSARRANRAVFALATDRRDPSDVTLFILACLLALTAVSVNIVVADPAAAGGSPAGPANPTGSYHGR